MASAERRAVGVTFFVNGVVFGTLASRLPWIAGRLHLSSGTLALVGLMTSIGALACMPFAAQFVHRYGPKATTRVLIVASSAVLVLPAIAPDLLVLVPMMLIFGALTGINDNAMNAQAVEAEQRIGKSIMSGLHGMWSLGVLAGALIGSLSARVHLDPVIQFAVVAATAAAAGGISSLWFAGQAPTGAAAEIDVPWFAWPRGTLLLIGLVGFASIFVEFAANDWSAVFMHWDLHSSQAAAAIATGAFAGSMAAGRLSGDAVVRRFGPALSVRACGVLGTVGCLLVATSPVRGRGAGRLRPHRPRRLCGGAPGVRRGGPLRSESGDRRRGRCHRELRRGHGCTQRDGRRRRHLLAADRLRGRQPCSPSASWPAADFSAASTRAARMQLSLPWSPLMTVLADHGAS